MTAITLGVAVMGAVLGWALSAPVYVLLGPAVLVSLVGVAGLKTGIDNRLRDVCFAVLGVAVGTGFDGDALGAMLRWPLAFAFMALLLWVIIVVCRALLVAFFDFDRRSALLAASPGHLSFVMAVAQEIGGDVPRVSMVQSVRLLSLTMVVPFAAIALGVEVTGNVAPQGTPIVLWQMALLFAVSIVVGWVFKRLSLPAPLLLGGMVTSALFHLTEIIPGVLPDWLVLPAYLVLGALIGTRFSGVTVGQLLSGLAAGLAMTVVAVVLAAMASLPVAWALGMPVAHVLIGFAPGGLETMIAMGAVLGVVPGFVAACHIARLLVLSVLVPAMLGRNYQR